VRSPLLSHSLGQFPANHGLADARFAADQDQSTFSVPRAGERIL